MRSPAVARELNIDWVEAAWPTSWDEKYGMQALPLSALSKLSADKNKPSLIYVVRDGDAEARKASEKKLFGSEDLTLATRFFRCYKIAEKDLPEGKIRDKYLLKKNPTFIILDAKGNEIVKNKKKASTSWITSKMKKQFSADFGMKLSAHVKKLSDWLDDLEKADDKLANAQNAFSAVEEQVSKKDKETRRSKERLAKAAAKLKKVQADFDKLIEYGNKLSNPQVKAAATAKK